MTIYFDENKKPYNYPVEGYIATTDDVKWKYYSEHPDEWDLSDGQLVDITGTEEYKAKKLAERQEYIGNLSMTRGDVFEALILARGITKAQIRTMIEQAELDEITKALYLNRFDEALEFYRKFPLFDLLGQALDVTSEQLDNFFITKDYRFLAQNEETEEAEETVQVESEGK